MAEQNHAAEQPRTSLESRRRNRQDPTPPTARRSSWGRHGLILAAQIATIVVFLAIIQWIVDAGLVSPIYLASPTQVWSAFVELLLKESLVYHLLVTLAEAVVGIAISLVLGVATGLAMGLSKPFGQFIRPFLSAGMSVPKVTLIPLIALYLGIGAPAKIFVVFLFTYFIFVYNTLAGIVGVDPKIIRVLESYGASTWQITRKALLPSATASIVAALTVTAGTGIVGALFAEMNSSTAGLGNLLTQSIGLYDTASTFALVIVSTLFSAGLIALIGWLEQAVLMRWKNS